ncbi:DUF6036 family nucleotidyltransferase [Calycomorphotria hydatis]|uniref:DUF6036 domain-containing protein n=1 Tax=Calycomorphotria hydatis TaxID=2528027 RepID=A0A517TCA9_9PLAN|nr:DUF6036 family nucleotidyltransferase [Calycomorphotria hydatis]QDT66009.1 hypothetical protein V22_32730 [Calycomorphotria hydatis]
MALQPQKFLELLHREQVEFIVIGGVAAIGHGAARTTLDIDIVYSRSESNLTRLVTALKDLNPRLRDAPANLPFLFDEQSLKNGLNFTLRTDVGDIDLMGEIIGGGDFADLKPHSVSIEFNGFDCLILDLPMLIHVKRAAGRPKDYDAIAELEILLEERIRQSATDENHENG